MILRFTRTATAIALAVSFGLVTIPACKKKPKPPPDNTTPDPNPNPNPNPNPGPGTGRDSNAPSSPVFGTSDPRTAAMRLAAENNMKELVMALHAYHDANRAFPAGYTDKDGKPGLSWRVALLPYIEQDNLFKMFKLDEQWNSEHNKKLIDKMPKLYAPPGQDTFGYTFYRGFTGPKTWLQQQQDQTGAVQLKGATFAQFSDGMSNTILLAEAYNPVVWTRPDELKFEPGKLPKLGGVFGSGTVVGMADGSVKFLRPSVSPKAIESAITINGGEITNLDE